MSDRENEVHCPYCDIRIRTNRIQIHLLKCRKHHGNGKDYVTCTYNATHIVQKHGLVDHQTICPNRAVLDRLIDYENDKMSNNNGGKKLLKGCTDVPFYKTHEIPCTEDWDDDTSPEPPSGVYIPPYIHKPNNITTSLVGMVQQDSDISMGQKDESKIQRNMDAVRKPDVRPKYTSSVFQYSLEAVSSDRGKLFQGEKRPNSQSLSSSLELNTRSRETGSSRPSKTNKLMELLSLTMKSKDDGDDGEDSRILNNLVETNPNISTSGGLQNMQGVGRGFWKLNSPANGRGDLFKGHMVHHMTDHVTDDVQSASTTEETFIGVGRGAWINNNPNPRKEVEMNGSKQDVRCQIQDKPTVTIGNNQAQQVGVGRGAMLLKQLNLHRQNTAGADQSSQRPQRHNTPLQEHPVSGFGRDENPQNTEGANQSSQRLQSCNALRQKQSNNFETPSVSGFGRDVQQDANETIDLAESLAMPILGIGRGARLLNGNLDPSFFPPSGIKSPNFTTDEAYFTDSSVSSNEYFETAKKLTKIN